MKVSQIITLIILLLFAQSSVQYEEDQGLSIIIHVLPHTHLDAGWIETFDTYYNQYVKNILDKLIPLLEENPSYRFNWAEIGFLERWWKQQDKDIQKKFKRMVKKGQIQFVNGGWVQHDEATVEYYNAMDQLETGWKFLKQNFGIVPHVGWQIDSFGHSLVTPTILIAYGIDTLFLTRVSTDIQTSLKAEGQLQFIWQGHPSNANNDQKIFVQLNQATKYAVTPRLGYDVNFKSPVCSLKDIENEELQCLDIYVNDQIIPFMNTSDAHSHEETKVFHFPSYFGDDFAYSNPSHTFQYIDILSKFLVKHSKQRYGIKMQMRYSTVDEYLTEINKLNSTFPIYEGDFLPYLQEASCISCESKQRIDHWSGFYSTKPQLKQQIRDLYKLNRATQKLFTFFNILQSQMQMKTDKNDTYYLLEQGKRESAILLHHDAVTGTHSQDVNKDYQIRIENSTKIFKQVHETIINQIDFMTSQYNINQSQDQIKEILLKLLGHIGSFIPQGIYIKFIKVFNPSLTKIDNKISKIIVDRSKIHILINSKQQVLQSQLLPITQWNTLKSKYEENLQQAEMFYIIPEFHPFGIHQILQLSFDTKDLCIKCLKSLGMPILACNIQMEFGKSSKIQENLGNDRIQIQFDNNGLFKEIRLDQSNMKMVQQFMSYDGKITYSGLYIFNPIFEAAEIQNLEIKQVLTIKGNIMSCIHIFIQVTKVKDILFENKVCLHHIGDHQDIIHQTLKSFSGSFDEIILRTQFIEINGQKVQESLEYFTDDSMKSVKRHIFTYEEAQKLEIDKGNQKENSILGLNAYPCNSGMIISDQISQVSIAMGLSHSVTCNLISNSTFEMILIRSLRNDDDKGLGYSKYVDTSYSSLDIKLNFQKLAQQNDAIEFLKSYNKGKYILNEEELIIQKSLTEDWRDKSYFDLQIFKESILKYDEVEFMRTQYDQENQMNYFIIRNTLPSEISINIEQNLNLPLGKSLIKDIELFKKESHKFSFINSDIYILQDRRPPHYTFESLNFEQQSKTDKCQNLMCLTAFEMSQFWVQTNIEEASNLINQTSANINESFIFAQQQQLLQMEEQSTQQKEKKKRKRIRTREMPIEGDTNTHFCLGIFTLFFFFIILPLIGVGFIIYSLKYKPSNHLITHSTKEKNLDK